MKKQLVVEIAEGLGNQLFMYAHAFSLARKINYELLIDDTSAYSKKKNSLRNHQKYMLNFLNIKQSLAPKNLKYDNTLKRSKKKIQLLLDKFSIKKRFIFEKKIKSNGKKQSIFLNTPNVNLLSNKLYVQGYFENLNYFSNFRSDIIQMYKPLNKFIQSNNEIINMLRNTNSVSIHIRQHRYTEQNHEINNLMNQKLTHDFLSNLISYIKRSIIYFENKIDNPTFFVWSNDFTNIEKYFDNDKFIFIKGNDAINDFNLFSYAKHFIVGASTFHWWGAWLNENSNKICVCPANINPSGNIDFYPKDWKRI